MAGKYIMGTSAHGFIKFCLNLKCSPKRSYNLCLSAPRGYATGYMGTLCALCLPVLPGRETMGAMQGSISYFIYILLILL